MFAWLLTTPHHPELVLISPTNIYFLARFEYFKLESTRIILVVSNDTDPLASENLRLVTLSIRMLESAAEPIKIELR